MTPSQAARRPIAGRRRPPRSRYDKSAYHQALSRACDRAFSHPTLWKIPGRRHTTDERSELAEWRHRHRWHPNQLRHAVATRVRRSFDLDTAQFVLGHARADVPQVYAECDLGKAVEVMRRIE